MSDIARPYPPATAPGLIAGTTASNTARAGVVEQAGKEKASNKNGDAGHDYKDLAR